MTDTKILQNILDKVTSIEKKADETNKRLDKIGKSVAYLEDDTPTIDEFNQLTRRVQKLEARVFKN